jgi:hypothetical protein
MKGISLGEFLNRCFTEAFPVLPESLSRDPKKSLDQFSTEEIGAIQVVMNPLTDWSQGDILGPLPFVYWNDEGEPFYETFPGMIMNSTCDLDRKDLVVVCPCIPCSDLQGQGAYENISKNLVYDYFYIGKCIDGQEWVVDLSHPMALPRLRIHKNLEDENISRNHSLTDRGWYLFITKFAMKYLRSDDPDTMNERQPNSSTLN